ncbi:acyloxyacyl hydrolase [Arcobacter sp.]|uniref:acyloxyacyl hydrolase n=1 Tax=Arcobacter sp. TaxID=1872629 RepID=UPI003D0BE184
MRFLILPLLIIFNLYGNDLKNQQTNLYINSISIGIGKIKSNNAQRVSVQKNLKKEIFLSDYLKLKGYFDLALNRFDFNEKNIYELSLTPVFKYDLNLSNNFTPYIFGGIGVGYLSSTKADGKVYSTHFQFEDRLGIGIKKDKIDFQLGFYHISNASIQTPNDGIDMVLLNFMYSF